MKILPRYALVLIALASGVLAVSLFGSILFGLAIVIALAAGTPLAETQTETP